MTDMDFVLMYLGLGFALSVIFIGKRSGGCMRNPPPPVNYVRPAPPPFPPRPYGIEKGGRNPPPPDHYVKPAPTPAPPFISMGYQPRCCCGVYGSECRRCAVNPPPKKP
ncbi:Uncharacterised protein [Serratia grimesii]|nr:Uncharacterised protein [Serratia grimesii]